MTEFFRLELNHSTRLRTLPIVRLSDHITDCTDLSTVATRKFYVTEQNSSTVELCRVGRCELAISFTDAASAARPSATAAWPPVSCCCMTTTVETADAWSLILLPTVACRPLARFFVSVSEGGGSLKMREWKIQER